MLEEVFATFIIALEIILFLAVIVAIVLKIIERRKEAKEDRYKDIEK